MKAQKHAVVTGTSSGIGRETALLLARHGFHVFATVRSEADGSALRSAGGLITPLVMDVTAADEVAAAAEAVREHVGEAGLDVLVNNAGQGYFRPLEFLPLDRFRHHLAVNTEGPLRVTQALLPALRARSGRIVFIGSISGWFVTPFSGSHAATKHALAALAKAFRLELAPWNVRVSLIEPGAVRTPAFDRMEAQTGTVLAELGAEGRALYGGAFRQTMTASVEAGRKGNPPQAVARAVLRAVTAARPRPRYLVGGSARLSAVLVKLPAGLREAAMRRVFGLPRPGSLAVRGTAAPTEVAR